MAGDRWPPGLLDEHALGWRAFAIVTPVSLVGVLTVIPVGLPAGSAVPLWLVVSAAATVAMAVAMAAGSAICGRVEGRWASRFAILACLLVSGGARGLAIGLAFQGQGVADRASIAVRTLSSSLIFALWLMLIGALISSSVRYRESRRLILDELLTRELQARLIDEDRARVQRGDASRQFAETAAAVRGILDEADTAGDSDYAELSQRIQQAVDERVRPLVHEMWASPPPEVLDSRSLQAFARRAYLARIPAAWTVGLYAAIATGAALLTVGGAAPLQLDWQTALLASSTESVCVGALILAERLLRPAPTPRSRTLLLMGLLVLPLLASWALTSERVTGEISPLALASLVVTAPVIALATCAAQTALHDRGRDLAELQARLDRDEWSEQLRLLEQRSARTEVASVIHNTMQARLVAAAMQLQTAALEGDDDRAATALRDARAALDAADVDPDLPQAGVMDRLASIVEAWRGIVDVRIHCDPRTAGIASARLAVDAVEECVANASRHAGATQVDVQLDVSGDDLRLVVTDDGSAPSADAVLGLGTAWMQRVSRDRMARSRVDGRNRVELHIVVA